MRLCGLIAGICSVGLVYAQGVAQNDSDGVGESDTQSGTQSSSQSGVQGGSQTPASSGSQSTPPGSSKSTGTSSSRPSNEENAGTFVRRFSLGATLVVSGFNLMKGGSSTATETSANATTSYNSTSASQRIGYGLTGQVAITNHIAVAVGAYLRRVGYQFTTTVTTTTPIVVDGQVVNVTSTTSTHEDTRARLIEVPLLVRYYSKGRHVPGPRWFLELGAAWRNVRDIRTSLDSTDVNGTVTCCTFTPAVPANRDSRGFVGGAGFQLIDPVGIRVTPEVRYTRWLNQTFDSYTTHSAANQLDVSITLAY